MEIKNLYIIYCEGKPVDVKLTMAEARYYVDTCYTKELYSIRTVEIFEE